MMNRISVERQPQFQSRLQSGRHSLRSIVDCSHPAAGEVGCNDNAAERFLSLSLATVPDSIVQDRQANRSHVAVTLEEAQSLTTRSAVALGFPHLAHHPQAIAQQSTLARRTSTAQSQLQLRGSHCKDSGIPEGSGLEEKIRHNRVLEATDTFSWPASNASVYQPQTLRYGELLWLRE
jgi:hypothetical protein